MSRFSVTGSGSIWSVMDGGKPVKTFNTPWLAEDHAEKLARQARTKRRPCLTCGTQFTSEGPHNRMCNHCRNAAREIHQGAM